MRLLQPFTSDAKQLVAAVESATSGDDANRVSGSAPPSMAVSASPSGPSAGTPARPDLPVGPPSQIVQVARGLDREVQDLAGRLEAYDSLYGIAALARGLGEVRGRKTILFFAEDREIPEGAVSAYDAAIGDANRANVTVHTVDTRGAVSMRRAPKRFGGCPNASEPNASPPAWGSRARSCRSTRDGWSRRAMSDRRLASRTPYKLVPGTVFVRHGAWPSATPTTSARAWRVWPRGRPYYEVVYEPARPEPAVASGGSPRRRCATRPARTLSVLRQRGSAPTIAAFDCPARRDRRPRAARAFAHAATVMHFASAGREREVLFLARCRSGARRRRRPDRGTYRAHFSLLGFVRDEVGRTVARFSQDLADRGRLPNAPARDTTAVFRRALTLPPGGYTRSPRSRIGGEPDASNTTFRTFRRPRAASRSEAWW